MLAGQVCVVSSHKYLVIWVDLNSTYLVNVSGILKPNMTNLLIYVENDFILYIFFILKIIKHKFFTLVYILLFSIDFIRL